MMDDTNQMFWVVIICLGAIVLWRIVRLLTQVIGATGALIDDANANDERLERLFDKMNKKSGPPQR
jgi:hypothetical protein